MKTKIDCGCEKDVFVCQRHCKCQDTAQHTPTPFEVTESGTDIEIQDANGTSIAVIIDGDKVKLAQKIVRAVNAHEELLSLVKLLAEEYRTLTDASPDDDMTSMYWERYQEAQKAIAKAEGK